jgi:hypothetical protein
MAIKYKIGRAKFGAEEKTYLKIVPGVGGSARRPGNGRRDGRAHGAA